MADVTATEVKQLRDRTGLPMMECKKALVEADGDEDQAVEILRLQFAKLMRKRQDNPTGEGWIVIVVADDGSAASMIELQCESAPVASNESFQSFADACARQLLNGPGATSPDELLAQPDPDGGDSLQARYEDIGGQLREKIVITRMIKVDGPVGGYVHHDGKTGVLLQATGENATADVLRDVAMHVASMKPSVVSPEQLDEDLVSAEQERLTENARSTGKPDEIIEQIVKGQLKGFYEEHGVLVAQPFVKDSSKSVSQALAEAGMTASDFTLWVLGN